MRAENKDIVEFFGFTPDDRSPKATERFSKSTCPFVGTRCSKTNHDKTVTYGVCAVTGGNKQQQRDEIIICPKRLYADDYKIFKAVTKIVWGDLPVIVGGNVKELTTKAAEQTECVVAFGQNSGQEVSVNSYGKLSMDWVLQRYKIIEQNLEPVDFVGIEIQSIDITGNYRAVFDAYSRNKSGIPLNTIPDSKHGLNWANVHKRLIPQIIRKGNVYSKAKRCVGFFFILPEQVYRKFDEVLGDIKEENASKRTNLSILTYTLGEPVAEGQIRKLKNTGVKHHSLENIKHAFINNTDKKAPIQLEKTLKEIIKL